MWKLSFVPKLLIVNLFNVFPCTLNAEQYPCKHCHAGTSVPLISLQGPWNSYFPRAVWHHLNWVSLRKRSKIWEDSLTPSIPQFVLCKLGKSFFIFLFLFFWFFFPPSLHLQLCRQLIQNISHWSMWVSSKGKGAPIAFAAASYPHASKGPPLFANLSLQVLAATTVSETQKERMHLNTVPGCREMQNAGIGKKRRDPLLKAPRSSSFLHMVDDQTSEEDSSEVLGWQ